jgi:hypothetical protein
MLDSMGKACLRTHKHVFSMEPPVRRVAPLLILRYSNQRFYALGGSGKAEGFADGEWENHRQAAQAVSHHSYTAHCLALEPDASEIRFPDPPRTHH